MYQRSFKNIEEQQVGLFQYIEGFYNRQKIHSKLNYLRPRDFEMEYYQRLDNAA
ncbi:IS3 family transposase [Vulcanibacillus modesticaldus]|uniref:IS3 family transposase n=1 Tax=Vulcanibacillus modesticaldus TaxID=337097 RepID=UPI003CCB79D1